MQVDIAPEVHELQELALGSAHTAVSFQCWIDMAKHCRTPSWLVAI